MLQQVQKFPTCFITQKTNFKIMKPFKREKTVRIFLKRDNDLDFCKCVPSLSNKETSDREILDIHFLTATFKVPELKQMKNPQTSDFQLYFETLCF